MTKKLSADEKQYRLLMGQIKGRITRQLKMPMPIDTRYKGEDLYCNKKSKFDIIAEINKDMHKG